MPYGRRGPVAGPIAPCRTRTARVPRATATIESRRLLADAEPRKDLAEQIVGGEFAGDRRRTPAAPARNSSAKSSSGGGFAPTCACARSRCVAASRSASSWRSRAKNASSRRMLDAGDSLHFASSSIDAVAGQCAQPTCARRASRDALRRADAVRDRILLCTTMRGSAGGSSRSERSSIASSLAASRASTTSSATSARAIAARVRAMPSARRHRRCRAGPPYRRRSTGCRRSRSAARPCRASCPGSAVTIAASSPTSRLSRLDLPTLGAPTSTTVRPSRSSAPGAARARTSRRAAAGSTRAARARRPRAAGRCPPRENRASLPCSMRSSISASRSACDFAREFAGEAARRRAHGRRRRRFDHVGDAFGLREIELAVEERALRELAGLGEPRAELDAAREQQPHDGRAAVAVPLDDVFAGVGMRSRKVERDARIDRRAVRVAKRDARG